MRPTICLSMIVKNESHCIEKCLTSVKPIINYWIISDTGSTDNTEDLAKNCLKDIPGEYSHDTWQDFSSNRNLALQNARKHCDYIFVIDADDYLVINNISEWHYLKCDIYDVRFSHGNLSYYRPQLFKSSLEARYVGVLHEFLYACGQRRDLQDSHIVYGANGARSQDPDKFKRDAEVLEKAINNEPNNSRYMFYCAQSYRDAGDIIKALEFYLKRSKMKGWIEEDYVSLLEAGKLFETIDPSRVEETYIAAHNRLPTRAEALYHLAKFYRERNEFNKGFFCANIAAQIPKPHSGLFIEDNCYEWCCKDELAVCATYINKRDVAVKLNKELLENPKIPENDKIRIAGNLKICGV